MEPTHKQSYAVPVAIVIAGALVAGAVLWGRAPAGQTSPQAGERDTLSRMEALTKLLGNIPAPRAADHRLGNPQAKVTVIEYSDLECPFCQRFHPTMEAIIAEYGAQGNVGWVYRHFPLGIHPKAYPQALASECVAAKYGNEAFWKFIDTIMTDKKTVPDELSAEEGIRAAAVALGLGDGKDIAACVQNEEHKTIVENHKAEAAAGGLGQYETGTPFSVIVSGDRRYFIDGAQPYEVVKSLIEEALKS